MSARTVRARSLAAGGFLLALPLLGTGDDAYDAVRRGNALYGAGQYEAAMQLYERAATALPDTPEIAFNEGDALYRSFEFESALEHFATARAASNPRLASRVEYNIGLVKYHQAIRAMQTFQDALAPVQAAIRHYRDSLQLDRDNRDARYNLELAYRLLRRIEAQKVQAQRHAETRDQRTSENRGQAFQNEQDRQAGRQDARPDAEQQPQGRQAQQAPNSDLATQSRMQVREASAPQEMSLADAEQMLEMLRERARAAESARLEQRRARLRDAGTEKYW